MFHLGATTIGRYSGLLLDVAKLFRRVDLIVRLQRPSQTVDPIAVHQIWQTSLEKLPAYLRKADLQHFQFSFRSFIVGLS